MEKLHRARVCRLSKLLIATAVLSWTAGCGGEGALSRESYRDAIIVIKQTVSDDNRQRADDLLALLETRQPIDEPRIWQASLWRVPSGQIMLLVRWVETDNDSAGVELTERLHDGSEITERYPVMCDNENWQSEARLAVMKQLFLPVSVRKDSTARMDETSWRSWSKLPSRGVDTMPPLFIGLPSDKHEVRVAIYDERGNVSEALLLRVYESKSP